MPTDSPLIGYGAFHVEDERYEDVNDWSFVADTPESLAAFLKDCGLSAGDFRTEEVRLADILAGRGGSGGMLCFEPEARRRFVAAADAAGVKYASHEIEEDLVAVEVADSSMNDITDIPEVKPLLDSLYDEGPPEKEIARLAEAIRSDPALAERCLALFDAEVKLGVEAHGALLVWLGFSLALAGDGKAFDRFMEILRAYDQDEPESSTLRGHYQTTLGCLLLYEESARRAAGQIPFADADIEKPCAIWDDLELLVSVCRIRDDELRKRVAAEAGRLLEHPKLNGEYVELVCKVLAAAAPERAAGVIPDQLERCEDPKGLKRILRAIDKEGSAESILAPDWQSLAGDAAREQISDLDAEDFDENDEDIENEDDDAYERIDELVADFVASFGDREAGGRPSLESTTSLTQALRMMWDYRGTLPEDAAPADIENLMLETLPRKVVDDDAGFMVLGALLKAFYRYMADKGFVENGEELVRTVERCMGPMVRNAADPAHWGVGKSIAAEMHRDRVDPTDPAAVEHWIREFNARPLGERAGLIPGPATLPFPSHLLEEGDEDFDDFEPPPGPKKPEPDPYEPCPCGSGKKYKWCCREKDRLRRGR